MSASSQKFIARNRAPRVQIEYDVELYGSQKKIDLPFVMGVLSDLSGRAGGEDLPAVADRRFLEIDVDNFDERMRGMRPRVAFSVPNTLTGEGNLAVDIAFESLDDFTPAAIAAKVEPLRQLLAARKDLANLLAYMDGKAGAETLLEQVLASPGVLSALAAETPTDATAAALASLRALTPAAPPPDTTADVLAALRGAAPARTETPDPAADALASLRAAAPVAETPDPATDALAALRAAAPAAETPDPATDALASLRAAAPAADAAHDPTADALAALKGTPPPQPEPPDTAVADALAGLRAAPPAETAPDTAAAAAFDALRAAAPTEPPPADPAADALAALRAVSPPPAAAPETDGTTDALASIRTAAPVEGPAADDPTVGALAALRAATPTEPPPDTAADALDALRSAVPVDSVSPDATFADALASLGDFLPSEPPGEDTAAQALDALRAPAPAEPSPDETGEALAPIRVVPAAEPGDPLGDLEALLGGPAPLAGEPEAEAAQAAVPDGFGDLDDLLGDPLPLEDDRPPPPPEEPVQAALPEADWRELLPVGEGAADVLDALLGETPPPPEPAAAPVELPSGDLPADLDALLGGPEPLAGEPAPVSVEDAPVELRDLVASAPQPDPLADLDALLGGPVALESPEPPEDPTGLTAPEASADPLADLTALLQPEPQPEPAADPLADLMSLLAEPAAPETADPLADLDALLGGGLDAAAVVPDDPTHGAAEGGTAMADRVGQTGASGFGRLTAPAAAPGTLDRPVFRMAILGDFSGRAAQGRLEVGEALARRRAIRLDIDSVEEVVEGFATTLVLPVGQDGQGIAVELGGLDDLHPDELAEKVELFDELKGLRRRLANPGTAARALAEMQGWRMEFDLPAAPTRGRSGAASVPADRRLTDFQRLIGDAEGRMAQPSAAGDLIARVVGPHVVPGPNPEAKPAIAAVDEAMSAAMRLVLHHPEFQAIEAAWRSLDLIARQIETDEKLEITIFDISAEEFAADLGTPGDLSQTGTFRLLNEPLTVEGGVGYSAIFGLYTFEETPPHADLLGRMGRIAAHVHAPFVAAMAPGFMEVARRDRHPLVAAAWDGLRADPAAAWLGLTAPRFLLRRPYGRKTEPIDAFAFEEFTMAEGLSGMLWGNPAALVAVLLARAWTDGRGRSMDLGKIMSLSGMPYHVVTDAHGDQIALPCTERNVTTDKAETIVTRGFMPVVSVRGRDVVRLASFQSLAGRELAGRWGEMPAAPSPSAAGRTADLAVTIPPPPADGGLDAELDALLAGFGDTPAPADPGAIDADLAALLEGL